MYLLVQLVISKMLKFYVKSLTLMFLIEIPWDYITHVVFKTKNL